MNDEIIKVNFDTSKAVSEAKKLNEQVSALKKAQENLDNQYKKGSISLEEYTKKTNALNAAQKKSQTQLKGIEGGLKNVNDVAKQMGGPGSKAIQALTGSVGGLNTAFKALVANPIIAVATVLVGVFIKLKDAIAGNEETQNRLNKVFSIFRPIGLAVSNIFDKVASFLVTCVEKMAEFIPALETGIQKVAKFITKFTPLGQIMKAWGIDLSEYTKEAIESFNEQAEVTKNLEERTQALTKAQREFADEQAETQDKIADLQEELAGDLTPDQLIQKTKELGQLRINDAKKQLKLKQDELDKEEANAKLAANSAEDNEKIAKLKREVAKLQRNVNKEEKKALKEETAAKKKIAADEKNARNEAKKKLEEEAKARDEELKKRREIENNIEELKIELIQDEKKREEARIKYERDKKIQAINDVYAKSSASQKKLYDEQKSLINEIAEVQLKELYGKESKQRLDKTYNLLVKRLTKVYRESILKERGPLEAYLIDDEDLYKEFKENFKLTIGGMYTKYLAGLYNDISRLRKLYPEIVNLDPLSENLIKNTKEYFEYISNLTSMYDEERNFQTELNNLSKERLDETLKLIDLDKERSNLEKKLYDVEKNRISSDYKLSNAMKQKEDSLKNLKLKYGDLIEEVNLLSEAEKKRITGNFVVFNDEEQKKLDSDVRRLERLKKISSEESTFRRGLISQGRENLDKLIEENNKEINSKLDEDRKVFEKRIEAEKKRGEILIEKEKKELELLRKKVADKYEDDHNLISSGGFRDQIEARNERLKAEKLELKNIEKRQRKIKEKELNLEVEIFEKKIKFEEELEKKRKKSEGSFIEHVKRSYYDYQDVLEQIKTEDEASNSRRVELERQFNEAKESIDILYAKRKENIELESAQRIKEINKEAAMRTLEYWETSISGIGDIFNSLSDLEKDNSRKQYQLQMMAAYMNMASALAKGISGAAEAGWPAMLATIPATVASIIAQFAQIKKLQSEAKNAKFSKGGTVFGQGSGTSDDINAKLSNGESVINQRATSMYAPLLSAINQSTGGNPIIAQGNNHTLARELALAVSAQPAPIVAVSDINTGQNRVKYVKTVGKI